MNKISIEKIIRYDDNKQKELLNKIDWLVAPHHGAYATDEDMKILQAIGLIQIFNHMMNISID